MIDAIKNIFGSPILSIISGAVAVFAAWFLSKTLLKYYQAYQDKKTQQDIEDARIKAQRDNQKANAESDKLKDIDGR